MSEVIAELLARFGDIIHEIPELADALIEKAKQEDDDE